MTSPGKVFLDTSRAKLMDGYLPRVRRCLDRLDDGDVWWRPNDVSNSVGNLILHLAGNLRQWVVSAVGGAPDVRRRRQEFDETGPMRRDELLDRLESAVRDAAEALEALDADALLERRSVQGMDVSVLEAVYHAVEHFSMHTGQIIWATKLRTGEDLGFYRIGEDGTAEARW